MKQFGLIGICSDASHHSIASLYADLPKTFDRDYTAKLCNCEICTDHYKIDGSNKETKE